MPFYRASPDDGVAWVTGASSGIGRELALALARYGYTVAASARSVDELEKLAASAGGKIFAFPCDVTDTAACAETVERIEREVGPLALVVLNAGTYAPSRGERLDVKNFDKTIDVNLKGTVNALVPAVAALKAHGRGQIAVVGSLTSYFGLPGAAAYGATKAALNSMAQSLKFDLDKMNIRIQVINPGFVETPLTDKNDFAMPGLMPVEKAAQRIVDGLRRGGFEIAFPRRLAWPMAAVRLLPRALMHWLVTKFTGWDKRALRP